MFYEDYEQKILKYANIKNKIMRFKALIISVIALISALTIAFLSTKGMVLKEITLPENIAYGDTIECSTDALFSDVLYYEYRAAGSTEWSQSIPTEAGEYYVRAVTDKAFGKGYSKEKKFIILPKELAITIDSESVVYGSNPLYSVSGLEYNDKIEKISFDFENLKLAKTKVELNVNDLVIKNSEGNDVTTSYSIKTEAKDITLNPYDIVIKPNSMSKEYDGTPLVYDNSFTYLSGGMLYEDSISITTSYSTDYPTNVGVYTNEINTATILNGSDDISFHYNIKKMTSTLEITKRAITIKTNSATRAYNGQALSQADYELTAGSLVDGHRLVVNNTSIKSIINVGSVTNSNEYSILDKDNNDVTANYDITYDYGSLEITPYEVEINLANSTKVYDGQAYLDYSEEFTLNKQLFNNDTITITTVIKNELDEKTNALNVGSYYLHVDNISFTSGGNDSIKNNYSFTYNRSNINITKRDITLEAVNQSSVYDGLIYSYPNNSYVIVKDNGIETNTTILIDESNVCVEVKYNEAPCDAGSYEVLIASHNEELNKNYNVSYSDTPAVLTIERRKATLEAVSQNAITYNAKVYSYPSDSYKVVYDNNEYVNNDSLIDNARASVNVEFRNSNNEIVTPKNAGTYSIYINSHNEKLDINYDISYSIIPAYITITPKSVAINLKDSSKIYDNNVFDDYDASFTLSPNLYNNDSIKITTYITDLNDNYISAINAGSYYLNVDLNSIIFTSGGNDSIIDNYSFTYNKSNITIERRTVTIEAVDQESKVYDSMEYSYNSTSYKLYDYDGSEITSLVDNSSVYVGVRYINFNLIDDALFSESKVVSGDALLDPDMNYNSPINVGKYQIYIKSHNDELNFNYDVKYSNTPAYVEITPLDIEINLFDDSKVYDAAIFNTYNKDYTLNPTLYNGDSIEFSTYVTDLDNDKLEAIDTGSYYLHVDLDSIRFTSGDGYSISDNYSFTYNTSNLTITHRNIVLEAKIQNSIEYNSEVYLYPTNEFVLVSDNYLAVEKYSLIGDDSVTVEVEFRNSYNDVVTPKNAGIYYMYVVGHNNELDKNYNVQYSNNGVIFEITPKAVTINLKDSSKIYDNNVFDDYDASFTLSPNLYNNDSIKITTYITDLNDNYISAINAGSYYLNVDLNSIIFTSGGNDSIIDNYSFTYNKSNITIERRTVTIEAVDQESKVYDSMEYSYNSTSYKLYDYDGSEITSLVDNSSVYVGVRYTTLRNTATNAINVGKYQIYISSHNEQLNANYDVKYSTTPAYVEITPLDVVIKLKDDEKVYDGKEFVVNTKHTPLDPNLYNGDSITFTTTITDLNDNSVVNCINAGSYYLHVNLYDIKFTSGDGNSHTSIKENYNFDYEKSTLTITKRDITLEANPQDSIEYNSKEYTYPANEFVLVKDNGEDVRLNELIDKESVTVDIEFRNSNNEVVTPKNAGIYYMYVVGHNKELDKNYNVTYSNIGVEFEITPCLIDVDFEEIADHMYDGKVYDFEVKYKYIRKTDNEEGLYNGDEFTFGTYVKSTYDEVKNVDLYIVTINPMHLMSPELYFISGGNDSIAGNYQLFEIDENTDAATLLARYTTNFKIIPRPITLKVKPQDDSIYNASAYNYPKNEFIVIDENPGAIDNQYELIDGSDVELSVIYYDSNQKKISNPIDAGTYYIGLQSAKILTDGKELNNYAITYDKELVEFTINKREITLEAKSQVHTYNASNYVYPQTQYVVIDENIDATDNPYMIIGGQEVKLSVYYKQNNEIVSPLNVGEYEIYIEGYNNDSEELNTNYIINISNNPAVLTINPVNVSVTPTSITRVYNGKVYTPDNTGFGIAVDGSSTPSQLYNGDTITLELEILDKNSTLCEPINAGIYTIRVKENSIIFTSGDDISVSDNYNFNLRTSTLKIDKRKITLYPKSQDSIIYNGEEFIYPKTEFIVLDENEDAIEDNTRLIDDAYVEIDVVFKSISNQVQTPKNANTYYMFVDGYNEELKTNYNITLDIINGVEFIIKPYDVVIELFDDSKVYDAQCYDSNNELDYDKGFVLSPSLYNNDSIKLTNYITDLEGNIVSECINAGNYYLHTDLEKISFTSGGNDSIITNYNFDYIKSKLEIERRSVTLEAKPQDSIEYNSNVYSYPANEFVLVSDNGNLVNEYELIGKDSVSLAVEFRNSSAEVVTPKNAGSYYIYIVGHNKSLDSNYVVSYSNNGVLFTITPKLINIILTDSSKEYDSKEFNDYDTAYTFDRALHNNDSIKFKTYITNLNDISTICKNAGSYYLHADLNSIIFTSGGNDSVVGNYTFDYQKSNITITPKKITIGFSDYSKIFDNEAFIYDGAYSLTPNLYNSDYIEFNAYTTDLNDSKIDMIVNAGSYYLHADVSSISFTSGGNDSIKENYSFDYIKSNIRINRRQITLEAVDHASKVYDSYEYSYNSTSYKLYDYDGSEISSLIDNSYIFVGVKYQTLDNVDTKAINVGVYNIYINSHNVELDSNYDVKYSTTPANVEITKKYIKIKPVDVGYKYNHKVYDLYDTSSYEILNGGLVSSHTLSVSVDYYQNGNIISPLEPGKYDIRITNVYIYESSSLVTSNYDVDYTTTSTLEIINITVTLSPNYIQKEKYYYGDTFVYPIDAYNVTSTGDLQGDTFEVYAYYMDELGNIVADSSGNYISPVNAGTYYIYLYDCKTISSDNSKYEIIYDNTNPSVVVIDKLDVTIKPIINEVITYNFNEQEFTYSYEYVGDNKLIGSDTIKFDLNVYYKNELVTKLLNAGTYNLEIVEDSLVCSDNYNISYEANAYTVKKLNIRIALTNKSKTYDGTILEYNNEFSIQNANTNKDITDLELDFDIQYVTTPLNAGKHSIKIVEDTIVAINNDINNFNITECYNAIYTINQREITITLSSKAKTYDGKPLTYDFNSNTSTDYIVSNLVTGEAITITTSYDVLPTHAGEYSLSVLGYTQGSLQNYKIISSNVAKLIIDKLDISIDLVDQAMTFSGYIFTYPSAINYSQSIVYTLPTGYELIGNDKLVFDVIYLDSNNEEVEPIFSGSYTIRIDSESFKSYSNGVLYNDYNLVASNDSILKINKLEIELEVLDTNHVYDDTNDYEMFVSDDYKKSLNSSVITCEFVYKYYDSNYNLLTDKPVNAGDYYVEYSDANVYYSSKLSDDAKNSIIFTSNSAELTISKRDVTITPISDDTKIYDGNPYDKQFSATIEMATANSTTGLLAHHSLAYKLNAYQNGEKVDELINAGIYTLKLDGYVFITGLESNYNVISKTGEIIIQKRPVTISPSLEFNKVYDDITVGYDGSEWIYSTGSLGFVGNDTVNVEFSILGNYITDNGTTKDDGYIPFTEIVDACDYAISISTHTFIGNIEDNYEITYEGKSYGSITPLAITVKTGSYEAYYNGYAAKNYSYEVLSGSLANGQVFNTNDSIAKPTEVYGVTDSEGKENILEYIILKPDNNGSYVLGSDGTPKQYQINYDITGEYGRIIVHKRPLTITTDSKEFTYNGRTQYCRSYTSDKDSLLEDSLSRLLNIHTLNITSSKGIRNVEDGPLDNEIEFSITDETGLAYFIDENSKKILYIDCYDITYNYGILSVIPYDLYVELIDYETPYTSLEINPNDYCVSIYDSLNNQLTKSPLLYNDLFTSKCIITKDQETVDYILYGGEYNITLSEELISITNEKATKDYKSNYNIHFINNEATITIYKKDVRYETRSVTKLWSDQDMTFADAKNTIFNWLYDDYGICKDEVYIYQDESTFTPLEARIDGVPNFTGSKVNEYSIRVLAAKPGASFNISDFENASDITDIDFTKVVDVTDNYNITYSYGTLTFSDEVYFNYDNFITFNNIDLLSYESDEIIYSDEKGSYIISSINTGLDYNNVRVKVYITDYTMYDFEGNEIDANEIRYVGQYHLNIDLDNAEVYIEVDGEYQYSANHKAYWKYEDRQYAIFNIYKSIASIRPISKVYIYDGTVLDYEGFDIVDIFDGGIGYNHYLWIDTQIDDTYSMGSTKRIGIIDLAVYSMNELGEYILFEQWADNYNFIYFNDDIIVNEELIPTDTDGNPIYTKSDFRAKFKCSERQLGVATESQSKLYDGKTFDKFTDYSLLTPEVLLEGHTFVVDYWYSTMYRAGTDDNEISDDYWHVVDSSGNDVSKYYEIVKKLSDYGELEIIKRNIVICSASTSAPADLDGNPITCNEVWVSTALSEINLGLADGDYIDLESLEFEDVNAIYVGEYENIWSKLVIRNANGTNVTKSYNITPIYGTITVTVPTTI